MDRAAPATSTISGADGVPIAVQDHGGTGPTVVLVHGYPDDHHVWDLVVARLVEDHHVVTYDVRGAGTSGAPTETDDYRLANLVADLAAVLDVASPDRPVHLVAHDWGSIQSWSAVLDAEVANRIAGFTSISGPGLDHVAAWADRNRRGGPRGWMRLARQGVHSWYIAAFHSPIPALVFRAGLGRRWSTTIRRLEPVRVDDRWPGPDITDDAVRGMALYRANIFRRRPAPTLERTPVPVQLITPTRDPYVPRALLSGIESFADDLVRVPVDAKHWIPRSDPDLVARLVREHVARTD